MTGRMLDTSGFGNHAQIFDISPHAVYATTGLALASEHCFGRYLQDDRKILTFGCVKLSMSQVRVDAGKALSVAVMLHYFGKPEGDQHILTFGNGGDDKFNLRSENNQRITFQVCAAKDKGGWENRPEVQSMQPLQAGQTYLIVAVLLPDGRQRLYIDGRLDVEGPGLSAGDQFTPAEKATTRKDGWLGRGMRPDTSHGLPAGIVWLQLYEYELMEQQQAELLRAAEASAPPQAQGFGAFPVGGAEIAIDGFLFNDQAYRGISNF